MNPQSETNILRCEPRARRWWRIGIRRLYMAVLFATLQQRDQHEAVKRAGSYYRRRLLTEHTGQATSAANPPIHRPRHPPRKSSSQAPTTEWQRRH